MDKKESRQTPSAHSSYRQQDKALERAIMLQRAIAEAIRGQNQPEDTQLFKG